MGDMPEIYARCAAGRSRRSSSRTRLRRRGWWRRSRSSRAPRAPFASARSKSRNRAASWRGGRCEQRFFTPVAVNRHKSLIKEQRKLGGKAKSPRVQAGHISPISPPYLPHTSPISPSYLPHISPTSQGKVASRAQFPPEEVPEQRHDADRREALFELSPYL